jgi:hypothetical protein
MAEVAMASNRGQAVRTLPVRLLRACVVVSGLWFVLAYLAVAVARASYPFELNYLESASVDQVARIASGLPLYVNPSIDFVPLLYTPLYFYLVAAVARVVGVGFLAPRLLSCVASLICVALIGGLVRRRTREAFAPFVAGSVFLATFQLCGGWFDLARVDSVFLALTLAAIFVLDGEPGIWGQATAGMLLVLAVMTKQSAAVVAVTFVAAQWLRRGRPGTVLALTFVGCVTLATWTLNERTAGWYWFYVVRVAAGQGIDWHMAWRFWVFDLIRPLGVAAVGSLLLLRAWLRQELAGRDLAVPFLACGAMLVTSWAGRATAGGYENALMPLCAGVAILSGLAVHEARRVSRGPRLEILALVMCLVQFGALAYDPRRDIPSMSDRNAMQALLETIKAADGPVLVLDHSALARLAGKRGFAHGTPARDLLNAVPTIGEREIALPMRQAICARRFEFVILDRPEWFEDELARCYLGPAPVFRDPAAGWPMAGLRTRPARWYRRAANCACESG